MADKHDLLIRLDSQFQDKGFKSAEASAKTLERELNKQERAERNLASLQMQAAAESERRRATQLASMAAVGKGFTMVGALAAIGLGVAAKAAIDWETAWAGVTKTVGGSTEELAVLEKQLRGLANVLPASAEEIAAVAESAGALGVKRQDVASFTKTMIELGVASSSLSSEEAADSLAKLGNVMGVLPSQAQRAGSALIALGNDGASTEASILEMAMRIAGAGRTVGLSEAQVMGFASALSSVGIEAEQGGSAFSRVMVSMAQSVDSGGDKLTRFARVAGMSATEFAARFKTDAAGATIAFVQGLGKIQKSGGDLFGTLEALGMSNIRIRDTMLRAASAGDLMTHAVELGSKAWEANTALTEIANKRFETTASRLAIARNQLNNAAIDIGANIIPALSGAADRVGFLGEAFHALPASAKTGVTWLGGIVSSIGLLGGSALIAIPKLKAMTDTLADIGPKGAKMATGLRGVGSALMGPWGLALAGATVALGIYAEKQYEAAKRVDELKATLDAQTGAITDNSRTWAVKTLSDMGVLAAAQQVGISLTEVTDAALGQTDAVAAVNAQLDLLRGQSIVVTDAVGGTSRVMEKYGSQTAVIDNAISGVNGTLAKSRQEWLLEHAALGENVDASGAATTANESLATGMAATGSTADAAAASLDALVKAVTGYGDAVNASLDAQSAYQAAVDDTSAAVKKNGETANKARTAIDLNTEAGRANDKALRNLADTALKAAGANFENGRSLQSVGKDVDSARGRFLDMATKMGMSKAAANKLADQLGLTRDNVNQLADSINSMPKSHNTTISASTRTALSQIQAFKVAVDALHDKHISITTSQGTVGTGKTIATGGPVFGPGTATSDSIPAMLSNGEYVINAAAVARYGMDTFNRLNSQRYASGGYVAPMAQASQPLGSPHITAADIKAALSGMVVQMDRTRVGRIVAEDMAGSAVGGFTGGGVQ